MSDFKAKYHALHLLQQLASGDASQNPRGREAVSPRKPGIRTSDDILREKYAELAELMAVQHLEQRAVSALQKMYLSPRKDERKPRKSRRRKKDYETSRRKRDKDESAEKAKKQRPQSASSNSSFSSYSSAKSTSSRSSTLTNSSRLSSASYSSRTSSQSGASSNTSRASSRSNSSRSSTKSKSSTSSKPVERHIVTIVEEEEEEEVINQDEIEERGVVRFEEEQAKENEEEARLKKEATKRTRRVSFVLEAEEQSSDEDEEDGEENASSDDTLKYDERIVPGEEDHKDRDNPSDLHDDVRHEDDKYDHATYGSKVTRSKYIEIENSILREILSPRSPRRMAKLSPRSEERSTPRRSRSTSPTHRRRNMSPVRAWEGASTLPLPPRPKRDISPCDHKLSSTDNPDIKRWLRHKNALERRQRRAEQKKERDERLAAEALSRQKVEKHVESEHLYDSWLQEKRKVLRKERRLEKRAQKEDKKREEEEKAKREETFREKQREKLPTPRTEKKRRKPKSKKDPLSTHGDHEKAEKESDGKRKFPSSNPFKGLTYDQWMRQKLDQEQTSKKEKKSRMKSDPDLKEIIPNIAKERIQRAAGGKGKRVDTGLRKGGEDMPECDQPAEKKQHSRPYTWQQSSGRPKSGVTQKTQNQNQTGVPKRVGLQRPSSAQNRLSRSQEGSGNQQHHHRRRVFSPSSARPEPQGSESNDDRSEVSAKLENLNKQRPASADKNNNSNNRDENGLATKAVVQHERRRSQNSIILDPNDLSVFMTESAQ